MFTGPCLVACQEEPFPQEHQHSEWTEPDKDSIEKTTLQGTNISPKNGILKMIFLFPRWDMLVPWRVKDDVLDEGHSRCGFGDLQSMWVFPKIVVSQNGWWK